MSRFATRFKRRQHTENITDDDSVLSISFNYPCYNVRTKGFYRKAKAEMLICWPVDFQMLFSRDLTGSRRANVEDEETLENTLKEGKKGREFFQAFSMTS